MENLKTEPSVGFDKFWMMYPKQTNKRAAQATWDKYDLDEQTMNILDLCRGVAKYLVILPDEYLPEAASWLVLAKSGGLYFLLKSVLESMSVFKATIKDDKRRTLVRDRIKQCRSEMKDDVPF